MISWHSLLLSGVLLLCLTGCTAPQEMAGCDARQQFGWRGAEWSLCPLSELEGRWGAAKLAGLGLTRTLTTEELASALREVPLRVRVVYFAAGNVRGTWAQPAGVPAKDAMDDLNSLQKAATSDAMTSTKRNARQVIQAKALGRVLDPSKPKKVALMQLATSDSLRYGVLNVAREHQAWLDARAVAQGKSEFICGLQVVGTPAQLLAFAQSVDAAGFTYDRGELFNSMRAPDPPDLKRRLERWPGTLNTEELLRLGQETLADFEP